MASKIFCTKINSLFNSVSINFLKYPCGSKQERMKSFSFQFLPLNLNSTLFTRLEEEIFPFLKFFISLCFRSLSLFLSPYLSFSIVPFKILLLKLEFFSKTSSFYKQPPQLCLFFQCSSRAKGGCAKSKAHESATQWLNKAFPGLLDALFCFCEIET